MPRAQTGAIQPRPPPFPSMPSCSRDVSGEKTSSEAFMPMRDAAPNTALPHISSRTEAYIAQRTAGRVRVRGSQRTQVASSATMMLTTWPNSHQARAR